MISANGNSKPSCWKSSFRFFTEVKSVIIKSLMIFCLNLLISAPTFYTDSFDIPLINLCFSGEQQTQTHLRFICMYVYIYIYIYGIHHWRIIWSSFRKLAWVEIEPTTTEFRSDALTDWAIRPWVQLGLYYIILIYVMRCAILHHSLFGVCMVVRAHANAC